MEVGDDEVTGTVCELEVERLLSSCDVEDDTTLDGMSVTSEDDKLVNVCPVGANVSALELSEVNDV